MTMEERSKNCPPYIPYKTFESFVSMLRQSLPARIDPGYLSDKVSANTGAQLLYAMTFLNLIDGNNRPTPRLKLLVLATGEHRKALMRQMADDGYCFVWKGDLNTQNLTYSDLENNFLNTYKMERDNCRKCINFFIDFCEDAGIPLSPEFISKSQNLFNNSGKKHQGEAGFIGASQKSGNT